MRANSELIKKYNVAGPRYTSYPPVPYWNRKPEQEEWKSIVSEAFKKSNSSQGISLYIHLPFCEKLCTYCGCNTRITVNHKVEEPYLEAVLAEWKMYRELFLETPKVRELHLGGGTPTFFSPSNLDRLISGILKDCDVPAEHSFSFEGHPNNTTSEHLQVLKDLGFDRVSFGIQDFDPVVQKAINRIQPFSNVKYVTEKAREIGYTSVNFDLVYGLPFQNMDSILDTIEKVNLLRPDRIAFYSYAHVPWVKPGQRKFTEADLPDNDYKRSLYEAGRANFESNGYEEIGMDHFALQTDELFTAVQNKRLNRNFMGYTPFKTDLLLALGASSISDAGKAFAQNVKVVEEYQKLVGAGQLPFFKGHVLTSDEEETRDHIAELMCFGESRWETGILESFPGLVQLREDGIIEITDDHRIIISEEGKPFIRNVCMAVDPKFIQINTGKPQFSSTI